MRAYFTKILAVPCFVYIAKYDRAVNNEQRLNPLKTFIIYKKASTSNFSYLKCYNLLLNAVQNTEYSQ